MCVCVCVCVCICKIKVNAKENLKTKGADYRRGLPTTMGQCFTSSRDLVTHQTSRSHILEHAKRARPCRRTEPHENELSRREQQNDLQRARNQIADLQRELRTKREESREQMNAMERDHLNQVTEMTRELSLKDEELRRLKEQSGRSGQLDRTNNLQQRDRD